MITSVYYKYLIIALLMYLKYLKLSATVWDRIMQSNKTDRSSSKKSDDICAIQMYVYVYVYIYVYMYVYAYAYVYTHIYETFNLTQYI